MSQTIWWLIAATVGVCGVVCLVRWEEKRAQRKEAEDKAAHDEQIRTFFVEVTECFTRYGFTFNLAIEYGEYVGQTTPTVSGGYIGIRHYLADDYMIELRQVNLGDATASYDQRARGAIHQRIVGALIYNRRSEDRQYFFRQNLFNLKDAGIEKVVASLVGLHQEYDEIWSALADNRVQGNLTDSIELCAGNQARIMEAVDVVLSEHLSVRIETVVSP